MPVDVEFIKQPWGEIDAVFPDKSGLKAMIRETGPDNDRSIWIGRETWPASLSREHAEAIWPILERFARTGTITE